MCGLEAWRVNFAPNQALPEPYTVESLGGVFYACTEMGEWIGPDRACRFAARRDAAERARQQESGAK